MTWLFLLGWSLPAALTAQHATVSAYPNPFQRAVQIELDSLSNDTVTLKLLDRYGTVVHTFFTDLILNGSLAFTYDGDSLEDGVYFLVLQLHPQSQVYKIIKSSGTIHLEVADPLGWSVYPNPGTDRLVLQFDADGPEVIRLWDGRGSLVFEAEVTGSSPWPIDVSSLPPGTYIVQLQKGLQLHALPWVHL